LTWRAYGASVRGTSHVRAGIPCQDAHGWRLVPGGIVGAVADGLGSAARAEEGAELAVSMALESIVTGFDAMRHDEVASITEMVRAAFLAARDALESASMAAPLRDLGTTLLLAIATDGWTAVGQIGDGAIVGRWLDGRLESLSVPLRGEFINETTPLTADDAMQHLIVRVWPEPVQSLALLSDGLEDLCINLATGLPFGAFFGPFFAPLIDPPTDQFDSDLISEHLAAFLDSDRVCTRTDDDKTLLLVGAPTAS